MEGISTELIELSEAKIKPCRIIKGEKGFACSNKGNYIFKDDDLYKIFKKNKRSRWHYTWFTRHHCRNERAS